MYILAIDPGNIESAYVLMDENLKPISFDKAKNGILINSLMELYDLNSISNKVVMVIEMIASYGMPVGKEVFDTCVWIGRLAERAEFFNYDVEFVYRKDVKLNLCGTTKAKDSNIRQALIDRFGEVGTKKKPGWFYGFKADIWAAYGVGVTYADNKKIQE